MLDVIDLFEFPCLWEVGEGRKQNIFFQCFQFSHHASILPANPPPACMKLLLIIPIACELTEIQRDS